MNVIDTIIAKRSEVKAIAAQYGVTALKLYGSVLARTETEQSDIDFITVYDPRGRFRVQGVNSSVPVK